MLCWRVHLEDWQLEHLKCCSLLTQEISIDQQVSVHGSKLFFIKFPSHTAPQVDFTTSSLIQMRQFSTIRESRCISVTIVDDDTADPGESFRVTVTSPNNRVTFRGGAVAIVIIDNDDGNQKYYVNFNSFLCVLVVLPGATNLRTSTTESRRVILMWDRPDTTSITVTLIEYSVQVTGTGGFTPMTLTTNSSSPFIVINNLFPYQQYQFSVSVIYELDNTGERDSIVVRTGQEGKLNIVIDPLVLAHPFVLCSSWNTNCSNSHFHSNHPHPLLGPTS